MFLPSLSLRLKTMESDARTANRNYEKQVFEVNYVMFLKYDYTTYHMKQREQ